MTSLALARASPIQAWKSFGSAQARHARLLVLSRSFKDTIGEMKLIGKVFFMDDNEDDDFSQGLWADMRLQSHSLSIYIFYNGGCRLDG